MPNTTPHRRAILEHNDEPQQFGGRWHTMTPGGHHGPDITMTSRPDGMVVRFTQADQYMEAFLTIGHCDALSEVLADVVRAGQQKPWPAADRPDQQP